MTLKELAAQYFQQEKIIRTRISELTDLLDGLRGEAKKEVETRICRLYAIALVCHRTGAHLDRYYDDVVEYNFFGV